VRRGGGRSFTRQSAEGRGRKDEREIGSKAGDTREKRVSGHNEARHEKKGSTSYQGRESAAKRRHGEKKEKIGDTCEERRYLPQCKRICDAALSEKRDTMR